MRMVERREMETGRLNIKETLPDWKLIQLCYYRYVIPSKDLKTGSHVLANANVNANGNASEFTRPTQTQGKIDTQAQ